MFKFNAIASPITKINNAATMIWEVFFIIMVPFAFSLFLFKTDEELSAINQADWVGYYLS
jgi:hypothetical protein